MRKAIAIFLCFVQPSWGVIAIDTTGNKSVSGTNLTSVSQAFTNTAGTYMVMCCVDTTAASKGAFSATYNSVGMVNQLDMQNVSGVTDAILFTLANPATGSNTLGITWNGVADNVTCNLYTLTGVSSVDVAITTGTIALGTNLSLNPTTSVANEWLIDCAVNNNTNLMTPGGSQTNALGGSAAGGVTMESSTLNVAVPAATQVTEHATSFSQPAYAVVGLKPTIAGVGGFNKSSRMERYE
jgi:hypothetical protein